MSKRSERKARAAARNARRQAENAAIVAEVIDPAEARRQAIRVSKATRSETERRHARRLNAAITEPPPDATVVAFQDLAEKQRQLAANLDTKAKLPGREGVQARKDRRGYLEQARIHDQAAAAAREKQLENWRRYMTQQEIEAMARARGEELIDQTTHVADWIRDEQGAIVRDRRRMPTLTVETAIARRKKSGLEHIREKGRITRGQYETGLWFGELCADVEVSGISGREETGAPSLAACKPSAGPADWKLDAVAQLRGAHEMIKRVLPPTEAAELLQLLRAVCFDGVTPRAFAGGDERAGIRAEERVAMGLAILRQHRLTPAPSTPAGAA